MFATLLQVALGGAIGSSARYLTNVGAVRLLGADFPWGTTLVNIAGSLVMGFLVVTLAQRDELRMVPFLMTGILGGFTTFSAFSLDAVKLWQGGEPTVAAAYVAGSVMLSIAALLIGMALARGPIA